MTIRKSTLRRAALAGLIVAIVAAVAVTAAGAASVTIQTPPIGSQQLTIQGTVVGTFPVYNGAVDLNVTYPAFTFPPGAAGSYRLSIRQNTTPLAAQPTWVELHIDHHWASDPHPTSFTFGPFLMSEGLCETCPSIVVVQPETVAPYLDSTGTTQYRYTPLTAAYSLAPAALTESDQVLFQGTAGLNSCGDECGPICKSDVRGLCADSCGSDASCMKECMGVNMPDCLFACHDARTVGKCSKTTCGDGFCTFEEFTSGSCPADCTAQ